MSLEKLKIYAEKSKGQKPDQFPLLIKVPFNPNKITVTKSNKNEEQETYNFSDDPATLDIELFFDTTFEIKPNKNVQNYTRLIYNLAQINMNLKRPPRCRLVWGTISGKDSVLLPDGFLISVTKTLTHFLEDGTPVRATLDCTFKEWQEPGIKTKIGNPIDDPVRIVKQGESLSSIATEEYGDPSLWRIIAAENRLINPRILNPGMVLTIPPLRINNLQSS
ncbi:LysM peptidoglycan-binding domain-containing protein [Dolichospermum sp. FACHB-1091]|uniref:CIS tube protein n=1 Tax=Dolichospermum sp. FACHB-1091 TaxID=2692798 RepID=UPI00167FF013|nr:LysM peptidoglycan-binding domain-containing protein [Dolichospermum sp. FACHB-1091]MBD2442721.1 LysM peptidoglycan-binding domain-containing protein [Dolichospermum sp. FACHB-1091]